MTFARRLALASLLTLSVLASVSPLTAASAKKSAPAPAYKGAVIMDAATGNVLFEDHQGDPSPPASMTKLMTFLVLHDKLASGALTLQTPVIVTAADSKIGGTQVWLKEKEEFTVEELLYAMMIQSANDAAYALARTAAGSVPAFVELMNEKARELGMTNTTFRTPHGLPPSNRKLADSDLTTPHDFALLARELLLKTDVLHYASVKTRPFGEGQRAQPVVMNNHNHLLGKIAGVDGLKTGFTNGAGFCLTATAERNGRRIIVVTMGSPDRKLRDIKVAELLERGFAALPANAPPFSPAASAASVVTPAIDSGSAGSLSISHAPVPAGEKPALDAAAADAPPVIKFSIPNKK
jgi:D-alanyl-D-alanine carboxypeptidase (penicillin-binding protein 5/6)